MPYYFEILRIILAYSFTFLLIIGCYCITFLGIKFLYLQYKDFKRKKNL